MKVTECATKSNCTTNDEWASDAERINPLADIYVNSVLQPDEQGSVLSSRFENDARIVSVPVMEVERKIWALVENMGSAVIMEMKTLDTDLHKHMEGVPSDVSNQNQRELPGTEKSKKPLESTKKGDMDTQAIPFSAIFTAA